ncbi:ABC transporter [Marinobacterium nitratireducens]|uniref:ABC transporter n=1 Tax=Marinobacterium nitratireducens TaxID=518897 RepID=A0A917ZHI5_9GAMM|nr:type I secretion system permease/ATPase [Marinobacterium nitratireducens]GGO83091.1 ABC transporter [Marinobacterium nitratireducens]
MDDIQDPLLSCLVELTRQNHNPLSADVLSAGLPLENNRLTPKLFVRAAQRAGLRARVMPRALREISPLVLPVVLLLDDDQACILQELDLEDDSALIIQPESGGKHRVRLDDLETHYSGYAIFVRLEYRFSERVSKVLDDRQGHWFWGTLKRSVRIYRDVLLASLLINLFVLASPLFVMNVYDRVVPNSAIETLWVLAVGLFVVYLFDFGLKMLRAYFIEVAGKKTDVLLSAMLFEKVMSLKYSAMPRSVGSFASNLREFESIRAMLSSTVNTVLIDIPFAVIFLAVILLIGGPLVVVPVVAIPVIYLFSLIVRPRLRESVEKTFESASQKNATLVESLTAMETVKTQRAASPLQLRWEQAGGYIARWGLRSRMLSSSVVNFAGLVQQLTSTAIVIFGVYLISERELTLGALIASVILSGRVIAPMGQLAGLVANFHQASTALKTLNQIMDLPEEREGERHFVHRPELKGDIEFNQVSFSYPGEQQKALDGVSFRIRAGEKVALIGRIGSGKSTVEKLLMGLYSASDGAIRVDGIDINQIDPVDLRRHFGYVPQDIMLFAGTLRENITLGAPYASDEQMVKVARLAGADHFVNRHPLGFDMQVGERGAALSGGQRQAVAVARALIHDPSVLILDEPSNAMDNSSEETLKQQLAEYARERTLVLVTHKMSLLSLVDRLIVIDGGKVVADGPKQTVLEALKQGRLQIRK